MTLSSQKVYFMSYGTDGPIKIGVSGDIESRLLKHANSCPYELVVLGVVPGGRRLERELHERHDASRMRGEWFSQTPELLRDIEDLVAGRYVARDLDAQRRSAQAAARKVVSVVTPRARYGPDAKELFIDVLCGTGVVAKACDAISSTRTTVYRWRASDPAFAAAWIDALSTYTVATRSARLERRSAMRGWNRSGRYSATPPARSESPRSPPLSG